MCSLLPGKNLTSISDFVRRDITQDCPIVLASIETGHLVYNAIVAKSTFPPPAPLTGLPPVSPLHCDCLFSAGSIRGIQDFSNLKYMLDSWDVQFHPQESGLLPSHFTHFTPLPSQYRKLMLSMWWISTSGILQVVSSILKLELATYVHLFFLSIYFCI